MKELGKLIFRYGKDYSTATIYGFFTLISLLVAGILFGFLHSTGTMKLVFPGEIQVAEFGGAFAGFFITLWFLIKSYNEAQKSTKLEIKGKVCFDDGRPVEGANVFIDEMEYKNKTNEFGVFKIDVPDQACWTVRVSYEDQTAEREVKRDEIQKSIEIPLKGPPLKWENTGDHQIDEVLKKLNHLHVKNKGKPATNVLFPTFMPLFKRAAFQDESPQRSPEGWKELLYVVTITEIILRGYTDIQHDWPDLVAKQFNHLLGSMLKLRGYIGVIFGKDFDAGLHFKKFGINRDQFVNHLPEPEDNFTQESWNNISKSKQDVLKDVHALF